MRNEPRPRRTKTFILRKVSISGGAITDRCMDDWMWCEGEVDRETERAEKLQNRMRD